MEPTQLEAKTCCTVRENVLPPPLWWRAVIRKFWWTLSFHLLSENRSWVVTDGEVLQLLVVSSIFSQQETTAHGRNVREAVCTSVGVGIVDDRRIWMVFFLAMELFTGGLFVCFQTWTLWGSHTRERKWVAARPFLNPSLFFSDCTSSVSMHPHWSLHGGPQFWLWEDLMGWQTVSNTVSVAVDGPLTVLQLIVHHLAKGRSLCPNGLSTCLETQESGGRSPFGKKWRTSQNAEPVLFPQRPAELTINYPVSTSCVEAEAQWMTAVTAQTVCRFLLVTTQHLQHLQQSVNHSDRRRTLRVGLDSKQQETEFAINIMKAL